MKSILISINPQHAVNILNGSKTLELRKSVPKDIDEIIKEHGGIWVYMYVTKGKPYLQVFEDEIIKIYPKTPKYIVDNDWHGTTDTLNGKVVARWWFNGYVIYPYEIILPQGYENHDGDWVDNSIYGYYCSNEIEKGVCITYDEIKAYGNGKDLYAWHISKLEILEPMGLGEFYQEDWYKTSDYFFIPLTKAPETWQYVWVKEKLWKKAIK